MFATEKLSFSEREERVLALWEKVGAFKRSVEEREGSPLFSFYDGPPFATGLPHYGHLLAGTLKDVIPRYKTMKGFHVPRRFGWDCHGLPVENEIEKARELSGAAAIEGMGIDVFNEECRSIVLRYTEEWKATVNRMGRWVDFDNTYKTMDPTFMESVWWVFKNLWDQGLVYQGFKVMPFSAKLGTPLSNFEANLNYQDVDDPSITVQFPLIDDDASLLIWTTTPWTLPSNLAAVVNPELSYLKIREKESGLLFYIGKGRAKAYFDEFEVVEEVKGSALAGKRYRPPFDYFAEHPGAFRVLTDDFVGEEDGTGIVHAAPAFGEMDFFVCTREGIEPVCPVDQNGKFTSLVPDYAGQFVKDADKEIMRELKRRGRMFKQSQIRHRYPFCWRSDTPLIYKAVQTWFVKVEAIKEKMIANNKKIHWVPGHVKEGRFGKWLENARDWAISRNRYWGTPIPIWMAEDGETHVMGSIEELEKLTGASIDDIHRHKIDHFTFEKGGKTFKRVPEVFDCWFESGSMPYAQNHYPFENKELTESGFPADFIAEGLDQTRGWFYTLNVLSTALFDEPAFKNVIVNGIILAEDGNKMSKRLQNYPDPNVVMGKYGADSIRLFLLNSPAVAADDLKFSERGVEVVLRQFLLPLWNSYVFLATYAKIYDWSAEEIEKPAADIDRWIVSKLEQLIGQVDQAMDAYELAKAVTPFVDFIEALTNWYIRRCRTRFWADDDTPDRREAFATLYTVLRKLTKIAAPFVPFISEAIYQELKTAGDPDSVHLCDFPKPSAALRDEDLEAMMEDVQAVVSMGHALRKESKLKVRQPLPAVHIVSSDEETLKRLECQKDLILDELNVKDLVVSTDEEAFVSYEVKLNYPVLGKKAGKLMKEIRSTVDALGSGEKAKLLQGEDLELPGLITLTPEDVLIDRKVKEGTVAQTAGLMTVVLDTALSPELLQEGLARELVNKINTMRRELGFEVTDRVDVTLQTSERVEKAYHAHRTYIEGEVLATGVTFAPCEGEPLDLNGEETVILLTIAAPIG